MALTAGSVTVDPVDGSYSGSGFALAIFEALDAFMGDSYANLGQAYSGATRTSTRQSLGPFATAFASPIVSHLTANAVVSVTIPTSAGGAGLQRDPASSDPTLAPSTAKTLTGSIT